MKKYIFLFSITFLIPSLTMAQNVQHVDLVTTSSTYSVDRTVELLKRAIEEMGLKVVSEVDHARAAEKNGLELRPTYVLLFGNPEVGTKLMEADQRAGLDLPLRILIWENKEGQVLVSYHNPKELQQTYQLEGEKETLEKMQGVMKKLTQKVSREK